MKGSKMKSGPGSRGGKIVGTTKGGNPIYASVHPSHLSAIKRHATVNVAKVMGARGGKHASEANFAAYQHSTKGTIRYSPQHHKVAAAHHEEEAGKSSGVKKEAHLHLAKAHHDEAGPGGYHARMSGAQGYY